MTFSRNTELEERLGHVDEELTKINDGWKMTMQEKQQEITEHVSFQSFRF